MAISAGDVIPLSQARANLSELADQVKAGAEKIITKNKGVYYYGKIYLGQSVREVVSWTKEEKNAEAFAALRKSMRSNLVTE